MELLAGYDSEDSEHSPVANPPKPSVAPVQAPAVSVKRVKTGESSEHSVPLAPPPVEKLAPLPDVSRLFKTFDSKLQCISKNSEVEVNRRMNELIKEKDAEREVRDKELVQERLDQFKSKQLVEEVIEFKGDNFVDEDMLKSKMKKEKEKIFIKNCMQKTSYEIRKARRERRDELLKKIDGRERKKDG